MALAMNALRWIELAVVAIALTIMIVRCQVDRLLLLFLGWLACSAIAGLLGDTPVARALELTGIGLVIWALFLAFRRARGQWRAEMERVKHL
jgi:hypothetical protein